ncbi:glycerol-3-phosphate dehydrogenase/oxidase [Oceanobacillus jeddahense]|uniref:Glycerol-3-phosphate dehydrogenase n=1 Tax=Oceanobacillus jeddahense TaxID=1462527 RepID=A0ABY5JSS8_9BACI|nr:glycerol-3-phosphate dehydrogenase/oxidase [Oceanobacillus jeddahense]UUI03395.1 glycerol-3-phosphate dehydrogenase/oxidase [Oceanobacillus jeddahense]
MEQNTFSSLSRSSVIQEMEQESFDLLIIGGGITGAGIALDATTRGLKVALIEKNDFASGTSSRSTKLIHGGLKYLQNLDFPVVKETGSEREIVFNNARHLVHPIRMNFPLIKKESYNLATLKAGLTLYDRLAGVKKEERHTIHGKKQTMKNEPLFNKKIVQGSGVYVEYRTDDSRLTLEVAKTAQERGAKLLNYASMTDFIQDPNNQVKGVVAKDELSGRTLKITANHIVNAAGPWVDFVRKKDRPVTGKYMVLAKGIHIVFERNKLPVQSSTYFQHKGRMIAVIPRGGTTYVGSTESIYTEDIEDIHVNQSEVTYLLGCLKDMFPDLNLRISDVISSWAGVRPLIGEEGKSSAELSRHDEIFESDTGLITIAGGKLTGYRKMAERIMQYIEKKEKKKKTASITASVRLTGGNFSSSEEVEQLIQKLYGNYEHLGLSKQEVEDYVHRYGSNTEAFLKELANYDEKDLDKASRNIRAEVKYTVENEMVATLTDFYDRRTSYVLFDPDKVLGTLDAAAVEMADLLNWDNSTLKEEKRKALYAHHKAVTFLDK